MGSNIGMKPIFTSEAEVVAKFDQQFLSFRDCWQRASQLQGGKRIKPCHPCPWIFRQPLNEPRLLGESLDPVEKRRQPSRGSVFPTDRDESCNMYVSIGRWSRGLGAWSNEPWKRDSFLPPSSTRPSQSFYLETRTVGVGCLQIDRVSESGFRVVTASICRNDRPPFRHLDIPRVTWTRIWLGWGMVNPLHFDASSRQSIRDLFLNSGIIEKRTLELGIVWYSDFKVDNLIDFMDHEFFPF